MSHTGQKRDDVRSEFASRRRRQMIAAIPMVGSMITLVILGGRGSRDVNDVIEQVMFFIPVLLLFGGIFFSIGNWRCPACNKYLGKSINPAFCGKCGVALR